jgi:hypothetical protein
MNVIYFGLLIVFLAAFWIWYRWHDNNRRLTNNDLAREMEVRATNAVEIAASEYGIIIDYSPDSVAKVEEILGRIHEQNSNKPLSKNQLVVESLRWGGYIGEVIRRMKPCHWELDSKIAGAGSFPIVFDSEKHETFPVGWCYKRIVNGPEDNVWHKLHFLVEGDNPSEADMHSENDGNK